jgi:polyisoprenoid-binding protein YceI
MKKAIFAFMILGVMISSCSNNGSEVVTEESQKVEVVMDSQTVTFATVEPGTRVDWRASHLGGVQPRFGSIGIESAVMLVNDGVLSNATIVMNMSALVVESFPEGAEQIGQLTGHLLSADFFNVVEFPTSVFELTNIENNEGDFNSLVTGNLTILDVTNSITFKATVIVSEAIAYVKSEDFAINRTDWGLSYNTEGTAGVPVDYLIANDIGFTIELRLSE